MALTAAPRTRQGSAWGAARRGRCHAPGSGLLSGLPCGATLSSPPSFAPHHYTCHPKHKTSPYFPSPALSRPAGRWPGPALPGPAVSSRRRPAGEGPAAALPSPAMAPEQRLPSEFRQVPRRALSRAHTGKSCFIRVAPRFLFKRSSSSVPFGASVISAMKSGQK